MKKLTETPLVLFSGTSRVLTFTMYDENQELLDLTDYLFVLRVYRRAQDGTLTTYLQFSNPEESLSVPDQVESPGQINVNVDASFISAALSPGSYLWELTYAVDEESEVHHLVHESPFVFREAAPEVIELP